MGDRWNLLIVRNLVLGPQTWGELRGGLPGVATNLLSDRLTGLEEHGVIDHDGRLYALTERGRELEPVIFGLASWGERHYFGPPREGERARLRYLFTALRRKPRPGARAATVRFEVAGEVFTAALGESPELVAGERGEADAVVRCSVEGLKGVLFGGAPLAPLVEGDVEAAAAFLRCTGFMGGG